MIHIYCGDGKGKTTAAVGLAVRCAGAGGTVLFYQFMKPETSSERIALQQTVAITIRAGKPNDLPNADFRRIVVLYFDGIFAVGNGFKWHGTAAKRTGSGDYWKKSR